MLASTSSGLKPATCRQSTLKTDKTKSFFTRPSLPLHRTFFASSFALPIPVNVAHSRAQKYMGTVTVDVAGRCWLHCEPSVGLQLMPGHTPAHSYDFSPHVHAGKENRWTLCAYPSSHDSNSEGYIRNSVLFGS
jgi:hypothetical protein